jgi:RNA polymerase sigma factor (sigma-70 family)
MDSTPSPDDDRAPTELEQRIERLLEEFGPLIRQTVSRMCPRSLGIVPDDIEQAARLRLWRALRRETEIRNPPSYIFRVVATATVDAIREVRARHEISLTPAQDDEPPIDALEPGPSPEERMILQDLVGHVRSAFAALSTRRRRAVGLHLQGFTNREIGDLLGWTEAKARNLGHRGLKELRKRLSLDAEAPAAAAPAADEAVR